jgi:fibronectin-binding autotransporter adhesin
MKTYSLLFSMLLAAPAAMAQIYEYDGDLTTPGIQNGAGIWSADASNPLHLRWMFNDVYSAWDNNGLALAEFGNNTSANGGIITVSGEIKTGGLLFNGLGTPLGTSAYSFTGGTLNLGEEGLISVATGASGGGAGTQWITFNSLLKGNNLIMQKADGSAIGFVRMNAANADLTGTLTLRSAEGASAGIYLSIASQNIIQSLSRMDVRAGSTFNTTGTGLYTVPISIQGIGVSNYGSMRIDSSNTTFSGPITLTGDARVHTHINTVNTVFSGGIGEEGGSWSFARTAYSPVNTTAQLNATFTTPSTYTGATQLGRVLNVFNTGETLGTEGGLSIFDFAAATAPETNLLYNNTTLGELQLMGGMATVTTMHLNGANYLNNRQSFSGVSVVQGSTAITMSSGIGGSMSLDMGAITRTGNGVLAIQKAFDGEITANVGGVTEGLIGTWATFSRPEFKIAGWAGMKEGIVGLFDGELAYENSTSVSNITGYTSSAHLKISGDSSTAVTFGSGLTELGTLSMTDTEDARQLDLAGKTLRLGADGGIQITQGSQALTVGTLGDGSVFTAGSADNTLGELMLTNMSNNGNLTINSAIQNNGTGVVSLVINGTGRTVLNSANTFTGTVSIQSGVLEVSHGSALGSTGTAGITKVVTGASLNISGGITLGETIQVNGHGVGMTGAIRNLSGDNTITPVVRMQSTTRFTSDSGKLTFAGGLAAQIGATHYTFSGSGDFEVRGAITATTGILTKEGSGTLTLLGTSTAAGATNINNGKLHLNFDGTGAPATNILYSGATVAGPLTMGGGALEATGKAGAASAQTFGAVTLNSGSSTMSAIATGGGSMGITFSTIARNVGATLKFDLPTSGLIRTSAGTDNAILSGAGGVAYATVGLNDWAATSAVSGGLRNIIGLSSLNAYTLSLGTGLSGHVDIAAGVLSTTLSADTTIQTLRFNQPQATSINNGEATRLLTTGGILVTPAVGANTTTINTNLRAPVGGSDLVIFQNNTEAPLVLTGKVLNTVSTAGAAVATSLTKAGPGTLVMEFNSAYLAGDMTGSVRIQDGVFQLAKTALTPAVSYYLGPSVPFILGSGPNSGKFVLGRDNVPVTQYGGLRIEGTGTSNAVVGGSTALSTFFSYVGAVLDFRNGMIGGTETNEDNLNLQLSLGTLQLGPNNTFKGKTSILQNTIEVTTMADRGLPSSLGTGDFNAGTSIIDMATQTTSAQNYNVLATLRYIGSTDSVTNRQINVLNSDIPTDVISVVAALENTGTGTIKYTSPFTAGGTNIVDRVLRLGGTNRGGNEIFSFQDVSVNIKSRVEKVGIGTWVMTGPSTYSNGTMVNEGTLLVSNTIGSATGTGNVMVQYGATIGGSGIIAPAMNNNIVLMGGSLQIGLDLPEAPSQTASSLTIRTQGAGSFSAYYGSVFSFDLFSGAGLGDNTGDTASADLAIFSGTVVLDSGVALRVSNPLGMANWNAGDQWRLFDWSGLSSPAMGEFTDYNLPALPSGMIWNTADLMTTGILSITFVPEPSRALFLLVGALALCSQRRRKISSN